MDIEKGKSGPYCKRDAEIRQEVIGMSWEYLRNNFSKFTDTNKLKVALELCKKSIPQEIEGSFRITEMPIIEINGNPLIPEVGEPVDESS